MNQEVILSELQQFAEKHGVELQTRGEVGFGRPCVGFLKDESYIAHNPYHSVTYDPIPEYKDDRLFAPDGVTDAYHKHDCLAVLVRDETEEGYAEALRQLHIWMKYLESLGEVGIEQYDTGARGMQAFFTGTHNWAVRIKGGDNQ